MGKAMLVGTLVLLLGLAMVLGSSFTGQEAAAQDDKEDQAEGSGYINDYIEALRTDVQANKRNIIAWNMELTQQESAAFWPVYRKYEFEMAALNDGTVALVKEYALKGGMLSDDESGEMLGRRFDLEERRLKVKKQYVGKFREVLPAHKVVRFYQVDRAIDALVDLAVASELPFATKKAE